MAPLLNEKNRSGSKHPFSIVQCVFLLVRTVIPIKAATKGQVSTEGIQIFRAINISSARLFRDREGRGGVSLFSSHELQLVVYLIRCMHVSDLDP